jgi:hypothetical protein
VSDSNAIGKSGASFDAQIKISFLTRTRRGRGSTPYLQATSSSAANANLSSSNCCWRHRIAVIEFNFVWMHLLHSGACVVLGKSRQRRDHRYSGQGPAKSIAQQYLRLELKDDHGFIAPVTRAHGFPGPTINLASSRYLPRGTKAPRPCHPQGPWASICLRMECWRKSFKLA